MTQPSLGQYGLPDVSVKRGQDQFDPLSPNDAPVMDPWREAFRSAGYTDGANISLEYQYVDAAPAGRAQRLDALLTSLVRDRVDVLFSPRPEVVLALSLIHI